MVRWPILLVLLGCGSESKPAPPAPPPTPPATPAPAVAAPTPAPKPPDQMDERMRHCPLALDGAASTLVEVAGGVRFTIVVPADAVDEVRRRAHHIVEFAAKKTRDGHGAFDGKGGGRMKNCPVVTDQVTIAVTEVAGGVQLDVTGAAERVDALRAESVERAKKFPFTGATVALAGTLAR